MATRKEERTNRLFARACRAESGKAADFRGDKADVAGAALRGVELAHLRQARVAVGPVQLGGTFFRAGEYFRDMKIIGSGARIALPVGRIGLS